MSSNRVWLLRCGGPARFWPPARRAESSTVGAWESIRPRLVRPAESRIGPGRERGARGAGRRLRGRADPTFRSRRRSHSEPPPAALPECKQSFPWQPINHVLVKEQQPLGHLMTADQVGYHAHHQDIDHRRPLTRSRCHQHACSQNPSSSAPTRHSRTPGPATDPPRRKHVRPLWTPNASCPAGRPAVLFQDRGKHDARLRDDPCGCSLGSAQHMGVLTEVSVIGADA